ncbi:MAG: sterol desaturase family protein [Sandaracinus sp.]
MISLAIVYVGLALLGPLFALLQRLFPATSPVPRVLTRARGVDWAYWLVTPLFTGLLTRAATLGAAAVIAFAVGWAFHGADDLLEVFHARSPLAALPLWLQVVLALVLADFLSYWSHRLRHHARFFPLHAVHHAATTLDWLAAARMHPIDDLFDNVFVTLPVLVLGFDPRVFLALGPVLILHTLYLHADLRLSLGPLEKVIATPGFHRWHHATEVAAQSANYGGIFTIWDVLFGTYRRPVEEARDFGLDGEGLPETFVGQAVEPLVRWAHANARAAR